MKFFKQKTIVFSLIWLGVMFLSSCAETPPTEESVRMIASPQKLSVGSGSEDKVFVQLLDKHGGPLFGVKITATSTSPTVASVTREAITDPVGKAVFLVNGISPGTTLIIFSASGQKATVEVVFIGH